MAGGLMGMAVDLAVTGKDWLEMATSQAEITSATVYLAVVFMHRLEALQTQSEVGLGLRGKQGRVSGDSSRRCADRNSRRMSRMHNTTWVWCY
ncbi:unnamed protein product [Cylicostephanus goldi]|uniref:Uncharacterized protein n=1 Tax=Cylicostephanus goldi TaxID=71465 RepID=A0A3P7R2H4_CYLGO|nr:unnamed protein product [Cylicostephanus goldi]